MYTGTHIYITFILLSIFFLILLLLSWAGLLAQTLPIWHNHNAKHSLVSRWFFNCIESKKAKHKRKYYKNLDKEVETADSSSCTGAKWWMEMADSSSCTWAKLWSRLTLGAVPEQSSWDADSSSCMGTKWLRWLTAAAVLEHSGGDGWL